MSGRKKKSRFPLFLAIAVLFFIGGFVTAWMVSKIGTHPSPPPAPPRAARKNDLLALPPMPETAQLPQPARNSHRLALVIDDIGRRREPVEKLMALGIPVTFAVLPGQPHTRNLAATIRDAGYEVLIHMPMEPEDYKAHDPGEEALLVSQSDDAIRALMRRAIAEIPQASGVNNHMGSLFTRDAKKTRVMLEEVKGAGLFFVDSLTTPKSVALPLAREMGIKSAARRVFLDNDGDAGSVKKMLGLAIKLARTKGNIIAIGHPHPDTVEAITEMKDELARSGIELVYVSALVR